MRNPQRAIHHVLVPAYDRIHAAGERTCTDALRLLGRLLEDAHCCFDVLLDHQLSTRAHDYEMLVLPHIRRLSDQEIQVLCEFVAAGGKLICTDATGSADAEGRERDPVPLREQPHTHWIDAVPSDLREVEIRPGIHVPVYPALAVDEFGQAFLSQVQDLLGTHWVTTDAPWYVRLRAWLPRAEDALVLHWVNYHQDEAAAIEVPWPEGPISVQCALPRGYAVKRIDWLYPEMEAPLILEHEEQEGRIAFTIPQVIVYGLSVLRLVPVPRDRRC